MIDIARFSIAPVSQDRDTPKEAPRWTLAGGRASRSVCTPAQRRAITAATGRRMIGAVHARRGVTLWHKAAIALEQIEAETPGVWSTAREVWAHIRKAKGVSPGKVNVALQGMARCGRAERRVLPGYVEDPGAWRPGHNGGGYWWRKPKFVYRLTDAGRASAAEGRRRIAEGRPDEVWRLNPDAPKPGRKRKPRLAEQIEGAEDQKRDE